MISSFQTLNSQEKLVPIASTRSENKTELSSISVKPGETLNQAGNDVSGRFWLVATLAIMFIAGVLRFYDLNLVPFHHDEGVNGNFLVRLVREGAYQYNPENYHGPTLYYFSALIPWLVKLFFGNAARDNYGMTTFTVRLIPALRSEARRIG